MAIEEKETQTTELQDLINLVERDDIPTNIFTIKEDDPLVLLGKLNEIVAYLKTLKQIIISSDNKSTQALENANNALNKAIEASNNAIIALTTANNALSTANNATTIAQQADDNASDALMDANDAKLQSQEALRVAQEALRQVVGSLGTKIFDTLGNLISNAKFTGHNGINVDMDEDDPETFNIRLDTDITTAIENNHTQSQTNKTEIETTKTNLENLATTLASTNENLEQVQRAQSADALAIVGIQSKDLTQDELINNLSTLITSKANNDASGINITNWLQALLTGGVGYGDRIKALKLAEMPVSSASSTSPSEQNSYIQFESGLIIQWGQTYSGKDQGDYQAGTINFTGKAFSKSTSYVIMLQGRRRSEVGYRDTTFVTRNFTTTKCDYMWYGQSLNQDRWHIQWVAIGY